MNCTCFSFELHKFFKNYTLCETIFKWGDLSVLKYVRLANLPKFETYINEVKMEQIDFE